MKCHLWSSHCLHVRLVRESTVVMDRTEDHVQDRNEIILLAKRNRIDRIRK